VRLYLDVPVHPNTDEDADSIRAMGSAALKAFLLSLADQKQQPIVKAFLP
jgi:hypothetical protein